MKVEEEKPLTSKKTQDGKEEKLGCLRRHELCECPKIEKTTAKPVYTPTSDNTDESDAFKTPQAPNYTSFSDKEGQPDNGTYTTSSDQQQQQQNMNSRTQGHESSGTVLRQSLLERRLRIEKPDKPTISAPPACKVCIQKLKKQKQKETYPAEFKCVVEMCHTRDLCSKHAYP